MIKPVRLVYWFSCWRPILVLLQVFCTGLFGCIAYHSHPGSTTLGFVDADTIWSNRTIPVCWENFASLAPSDLELVRQAVTSTWSRYSTVHFVGWDACAPTTSGIRVLVQDSAPEVEDFGNHLAGMQNGMHLNFTMQKQVPFDCGDSAKRDLCIQSLAVHEFGHALGFLHEHQRGDVPTQYLHSACVGAPINGSAVGEWDVDSIMSYCNNAPNLLIKLSIGDIATVQQFYGVPPELQYSRAEIVLKNSATALCVLPAAAANGVVQAGMCNGPAMRWTVTPVNALQVQLQNQQTGNCLAEITGNLVRGAPVVTVPCTGTAEQLWKIIEVNPDLLALINGASGHCLDTGDANAQPPVGVQLWQCRGEPAQLWVP